MLRFVILRLFSSSAHKIATSIGAFGAGGRDKSILRERGVEREGERGRKQAETRERKERGGITPTYKYLYEDYTASTLLKYMLPAYTYLGPGMPRTEPVAVLKCDTLVSTCLSRLYT